jgi:hypothetical protein
VAVGFASTIETPGDGMKITILMHEKDPDASRYLIGSLGEFWTQQGHEIEELHGVARPVRGDIVFLHVDMTVIPEEYLRAVADHPCVVNRAVPDISKTRISRNRVRSPEEWDGPVIVKTVRNHGGHPERQKRRRTLWGRAQNLMEKIGRQSLGYARYLDPQTYPIFDSARDVPSRVFSNSALMVERFLPERKGELYCSRLYKFLGDATFCNMNIGTKPYTATPNVIERPLIPPCEEMIARRREIGRAHV